MGRHHIIVVLFVHCITYTLDFMTSKCPTCMKCRGSDLQGADVNESDGRGITALGLAVGYNKVAIVKVLLDGGADVTKTDVKGSTVLHYAAG